MIGWKINLSEVIANGEAYSMEAPLPHYESLARKIQVELAERVRLTPNYDAKEQQFWLTDRIALESVLLSQNNEEVYIYNNKMYVAEHSNQDEPTIGYYYYGTLYPSIAVVADGIEVARATDDNAIVKIAVDAVICSLAKPMPKNRIPRDPSLN